jgi:hypothetical protein
MRSAGLRLSRPLTCAVFVAAGALGATSSTAMCDAPRKSREQSRAEIKSEEQGSQQGNESGQRLQLSDGQESDWQRIGCVEAACDRRRRGKGGNGRGTRLSSRRSGTMQICSSNSRITSRALICALAARPGQQCLRKQIHNFTTEDESSPILPGSRAHGRGLRSHECTAGGTLKAASLVGTFQTRAAEQTLDRSRTGLGKLCQFTRDCCADQERIVITVSARMHSAHARMPSEQGATEVTGVELTALAIGE